jgi:hypothetical protein
MFNDRQLQCLSLLGERIATIEEPTLRDLFTCLFSGCLEFNNLFTSYKGEGTGAVRHMFSHHILKPERTPIEANLWGTPKSSGAFSTLFRSRLLAALDYQANPFEVRASRGKDGRLRAEKVVVGAAPMAQPIAADLDDFLSGKRVYLFTGDSSATDVETESVDVVVTDPPFFDNVHYSELADFFYVWQRHLLGEERCRLLSTRSPDEVQGSDAPAFATKLAGVLRECHRVLKPTGLLVFTYHHSRPEGWEAVLAAVVLGGFALTQTHPIKAEMSGATPKRHTSEPIDLDIIVVGRKRLPGVPALPGSESLLAAAERDALAQVKRLRRAGRELSRNDVRVVVMARLVAALSRASSLAESLAYLTSQRATIEAVLDRLHAVPGNPQSASSRALPRIPSAGA